MKLEEFLYSVEGDNSHHLADRRVAATWDGLGHVWNIGPGLTVGVTKDTVWTQEELHEAVEAEFRETHEAVARLVKVDITGNQRVALESLLYNIGAGAFARSTVLKRVNARQFDQVPAAMRMWRKAGGKVCQGLINRREKEIVLWNTPDEHPAPVLEKESVPKACAESIFEGSSLMNAFGTILLNLLASSQTQSIIRSILKVAGTALVVKAGGDVGSVDTIVGGVITIIGALGSVVQHSSQAPATPAA